MESVLESFLNKEKLEEVKPDYALIKLISTETYNEPELFNEIKKIGKDICGAIAIQLAIVGYGNKKYGEVKIGHKVINIQDFFNLHNITTKSELGTKLTPNTLTPRRLIRIYRYSIEEFLIKNPLIQSYLYKKYCYEKTEKNRCFIFPGFENMAIPIIDDSKVLVLLKVYKNVDDKKSTNISEKIKRILTARGFSLDKLHI